MHALRSLRYTVVKLNETGSTIAVVEEKYLGISGNSIHNHFNI